MMKRFILSACAGLLAAAVASPSFAADLPRPGYKSPIYSPDFVAPFSWTGFYVGLNGGYGFGKSSWSSGGLSTGDFNVNGALAGLTLGYNLQTGTWVWGAEGDLDASWMKGSTTTACASGCETKNSWLGTGRLRLGYAGWNNWLPYLTGGVAAGDIKATDSTGSVTKTAIGWTAGLGVEYAMFGNWSTKLEYLYADLGKVTCGTPTCAGGDVDIKFKANIVKVGVNYRF
jgi:outer membrane immunogenic protein